jgi:ferredoxin
MKLEVDKVLCTGHGRCHVNASEIFRLDDDGYNADRGGVIDVPAAQETAAMFGLRSCPEAAIRVLADGSSPSS